MMTHQELAIAVKKAIQHDANRPTEERIRELIEAGIIDEHGRVFSENLAIIQDLLHERGFDGIHASHKGDVPGGAVCLRETHEDRPRAEGSYDAIREVIEHARDTTGLWESLEAAGYCQKQHRKKTG